MEQAYFEDHTFEHQDFTEQALAIGEYEHCNFLNCNFTNVDLSKYIFDHCQFDTCNLSTAKLHQTAFREVQFKDCKMLGLHFDNCNPFLLSLSFHHCMLNLSSFYQLKLKGTIFKNCVLQEVDFSEADFSQAVFHECDLMNAIFDQSILEKTDFRTAYNYIIHPENNRIRKAKFSPSGIAGLLQHYDIVIE